VAGTLKKQKFGDGLVQDYLRKHAKEFQGRAEREVRLALLLPKVVEAEKIKATDADFQAHFDEIVKSSGQKLDAIEKFYQDNTQRKQELGSELERRKALQAMLDNAKAK
jgi:FKBP-type peptidyl-prolyl cis-trans isomerase (trigger factor)